MVNILSNSDGIFIGDNEYAAGSIAKISGILTLITGALWHNCGSVFVVINAALLLRYKDK